MPNPLPTTTVSSPSSRPLASSTRMGKQKTAVFIVNPAGRGGRSKSDWEKISPVLKQELGSEWSVETRFTQNAADAERISRSYVAGCSADVIVAVGGDGTVNEVVNGFFSPDHTKTVLKASPQKPKLAVFPLGTGSDFARQFGWTTDPKSLADRIRSGRPLPVDAGVVTCHAFHPDQSPDGTVSRAFINIASMGMSARVADSVPPFKFLGSKLSYVAATIKAFFGHQNTAVTVEYSDGKAKSPTHSIKLPALTLGAFGNAPFFGGGMKVCPGADPSDGQLQFVSIDGYGLIDFALQEWKLRAGTHIGMPRVEARNIVQARITPVKPEMGPSFWFEVDGELLGHLPATVRVEKGAVDLLV